MFNSFLKRFCCFSLLFSLIVVSINYVVDPSKVFFKNSVPGFNDIKHFEISHRLSVALRTIRYQPKAVILGTSRVLSLGDNIRVNEETEVFANMGVSGANFDEIYAYFMHALFQQADLKNVIIGIDLFSFNAHRPSQVDFSEERLQRHTYLAKDIKDVLFTFKIFYYSYKTVLTSFYNLPEESPILTWGEETYIKKMLKDPEAYYGYILDPKKIEKFQKIVKICQEKSIDLKVFVCPVKACYWNAYYENGLWPQVENLKRTLCAIHPIWDFSGFNSITTEALESNNIPLYIECSHFTPYTGSLLLKRMFNEPSILDTVGYYLTPDKIESSFQEILSDRNKWQANLVEKK